MSNSSNKPKSEALQWLQSQGMMWKKYKDVRDINKIDLSNRVIKTLPDCIDQFENLTVLDLTFNQLSILPDSLGNLTKFTLVYCLKKVRANF